MALSPPSPDPSKQEFGTVFAPRFDANGLVTAVAIDTQSKAVLMVAHMNAQAIEATLETGYAHYWSRSRAKLWKKGESSGELQEIVSIATDCDQDALVLEVAVQGRGSACHNGFKSCFYRVFEASADGVSLRQTAQPLVAPDTLYGQK